MKHILIVTLAFLSGNLVAQKLELSTTNLDFGTIPLKPRTERGVMLYNRTNKPLVIKNISVDCNCTKVEWTKRPIAAGDSTALKVIYTPGESGVFYKKIKITSTQEDESIIIRGVVK